VGVPADRIVRMGAKDNFWSAGPTGPCGPCSELYYDQGPELGCDSADCAVGCDCDRYLEYWNLVFMQYDRAEDGTLNPLPKPSIDTGMGLERIAAILQGVNSNFETDILRDLMSLAEEITGADYGADEKTSTSVRIIADHARAVTFLIADGIIPSNEGRGYVLRRLLRRAVRHGRLLGVEDMFLVRLIERVIGLMGEAYPEIVEHRELITQIVSSEEERFGATLRQGVSFLDTELAAVVARGEKLDGVVAFTLHDTYGFPFELTAEIAAEKGVDVDVDAFNAEMEAQRDRARAAVKDESWTTFGGVYSELAKTAARSEFVGYEHDVADARIVALVSGGELAEGLSAGQRAEIVLNKTPFYGEQGGQVGDHGVITSDAGARFLVEDTRIPQPGLVAHVGVLEAGTLEAGEGVHAVIDVMRRERIRRNHTATHLLHWALRLVLGDHAKQSGSLVRPDRMRFDFTHFEAMSATQLEKVERLVNAKIFENHVARAYETSIVSAREAGVTALFGEKYGDFVRVLEVGNFSKELCGGTHVGRTSEIGLLKIVSEGSVGANLRRIEAVTSFDAYDYVMREESELLEAAAVFKVPRFDVSERAAATVKKLKELEAGTGRVVSAVADDEINRMLADTVDVGYKLIVSGGRDLRPNGLRITWDILRARGTDALVLVATDVETGKPIFLSAGTDAAVAAGFDAGAVVRAIAPALGGRGGGKPAMAQGGGEDAAGIDDALRIARETLGVG
jgi:alanyl-tRNA synthetase